MPICQYADLVDTSTFLAGTLFNANVHASHLVFLQSLNSCWSSIHSVKYMFGDLSEQETENTFS